MPDRAPASGPLRVVLVGAGFGGLEVTTRLSDELGKAVDIVLVDRTDDFVFGFSKLDVMFGRRLPEQVRHRYTGIVKPGVRFVTAEVKEIDPRQRRIETSAGSFEADVLVIALGADLDPGATPGLVVDGHEFYTEQGAFALRDILAAFEGGKVIVAVTSTPYKCPPAPDHAGAAASDAGPTVTCSIRGPACGVRRARHRVPAEPIRAHAACRPPRRRARQRRGGTRQTRAGRRTGWPARSGTR